MRGMRPGLGVVMAALVLGACGTAGADLNDTTTSARPAPTAPTRSVGAAPAPRGGSAQQSQGALPLDSRGPVFPLTLRRTGGIAGYDDTVVLEPAGQVLVETRNVRGRICVLAKPQREELFSLLATLRQVGPADGPVTSPELTDASGSGAPAESEVIRISLTDARNKLFDLTDPSLGSVSGLVGGLVSDVTLTSPLTVSCTNAGA